MQLFYNNFYNGCNANCSDYMHPIQYADLYTISKIVHKNILNTKST